MKVVHLYDGHEKIYEGKGSLPRIIWNIARRTTARGHDVTVLERQWRGLQRKSTHEGVNFRRLRLRTGSDEPWDEVPYEMVTSLSGSARLIADRVNFAIRALLTLRDIEFDILHVYLPFAANVIVSLTPRYRNRMVFTAQLGELRLGALGETDDEDAPDAPAFLSRFSPDVYLAKRVAYTTVLNPNIKRIFEDAGVDCEKVVHIPNGVDIEGFSHISSNDLANVRETYQLDNRPIIFFVGTVMPRKGVVQLIRAFAAVATNRNDDVQLVIAGESDLDESYTQRVRSLINELGIEDAVTFTGFLTDDHLVPLYGLSDIFVLPSFEEGFGMVVSEAMATGTPVVASDINGIRQQIEDGQTGFLVEPGNVEELAEALLNLLNDETMRETMAERSQRKANQFSWESVTDQYVDVYNRV